ncbi:MAG: glycosyltransferase family 4 protein [Chloroflexi bacterium]|nr:glycosyltransferase family 4 protein [Chloroflexota bacterium]
MRILHLIQRYWPALGGAEAHLQALSERLARDGHAVTVATTDVADIEGFWTSPHRTVDRAVETHAGVTIRRFALRQPPVTTFAFRALRRVSVELSRRRIGGIGMLRALGGLALSVPGLHRWLRTQRGAFDLVAASGIGFESLYWPAADWARREGIPFLMYPLTHLAATPARGGASLSDYYTMRHQAALLKASAAVIALTELEAGFWADAGIPRERLVVAGAGADPAAVTGGDVRRFRALIGTDEPIVLALGTQTGDKGTLHLIGAMQRLWERGAEARLVLAGQAMPDVTQVLARASSTVRCGTHLLGPVDDETKRDALAACSLLALPSRTDSFGIVLLEAWLNRKPVIGARAGALPSVITEGQDGLLVEWGDGAALAAAVERLLGDGPLRMRLGQAGRDKVLARFTWDAIYPLVRDTYERACETVARS